MGQSNDEQNNKKKKYLIPVDGKLYETTKEIYEVYYQMDRRERYLEERDIKNGVMNFGDIEDTNDSAEERIVDENTNIEMEVIDKILYRAVLDAMSSLSEEENWLIQELFFYGQKERELSRKTGIPRKTINYRKQKALSKIRKFINI